MYQNLTYVKSIPSIGSTAMYFNYFTTDIGGAHNLELWQELVFVDCTEDITAGDLVAFLEATGGVLPRLGHIETGHIHTTEKGGVVRDCGKIRKGKEEVR